MKHVRILMLIASLFLLLACGGSTKPGKLRIERPSPSVTEACAGAQALPDRALVQSETERLWSRDRRNLGRCAAKQAQLVAWVEGVVGVLGVKLAQ